jgi:hypothetical protein
MVSAVLDSDRKHGKSQGLARFAGSGIAGLCELTLFHPVDTMAKRLMNSQENLSKENYR